MKTIFQSVRYLVSKVKIIGRFFQIFVAFSEYLNFMLLLQATDQTFCISVAIHGRYHQKLGAQWTVKKILISGQIFKFVGLVKKIEKKLASNEHK